MADAVPFTIGSDATCTDGPCGQVKGVVVDPAKREITHLVIEPAHRQGLGRLVPLDLLERRSPEVRLRCTTSEFENLPLAEETDFLPGGSGYADYAAHEAYYWPYYGLGAVGVDPVAAVNASAIVTHDSLPVGEVGVRRGEPVHATDGEIGRVEGLVMEPVHHHVTHVLLQEGHLWGRKEVAIPIGAVTTIDGGISIKLTKQRGGGPAARRRAAISPARAGSELEHEPAAHTAGLEQPVRLRRLGRRQGPGHPERDRAVLGLLAQPVELGLFPGVGADEHREERDAACRRPGTLVAADGDDPSAIRYGGNGQFVEECAVDQAVGALRRQAPNRVGVTVAAGHHHGPPPARRPAPRRPVRRRR